MGVAVAGGAVHFAYHFRFIGGLFTFGMAGEAVIGCFADLILGNKDSFICFV
jgi:hypothetical protein